MIHKVNTIPELKPTDPTVGPDKPVLIRILLRHALVAIGFNVIVALFIGLILHSGEHILGDFVFSMCIGMLAWLFVDCGRLLLWGEKSPLNHKFFLLLIMAVPAAYYVGVVIGAFLLGYPLKQVLPDSSFTALVSMGFTLTAALLGTWIFWSRTQMAEWKAKVAEQQAHSAAIEKQALQAQLQLLQTQIEPHMLFNTLANLQGLIAIDPPRAQHMLDQLIQYLRVTLHTSRAEATTLAHEFALLEAYLGLMSVRMGARLSYGLQLPDDLRNMHMPPMLLQPLIENAIKHGLEPKIEGGRVDVSAEQHNGTLVLTVADTGLGIDDAGSALHSQPGTQVGVANIRERLHALYGNDAQLSLTSNTPSGVIARLTLPLAP